MVSIMDLKRNIQQDPGKTKYILYFNNISRQEFYAEARNDRELEVEMRLLKIKPWCTRIRISVTKPLRAQRSH